MKHGLRLLFALVLILGPVLGQSPDSSVLPGENGEFPADQGPPENSSGEQGPGPPGATGPVPPGCSTNETAAGVLEISCEFDKSAFSDFDLSAQVQSCADSFEMINGSPACIARGKTSFKEASCPSAGQISALKSKCDGELKEFVDEANCNAVVCLHSQFKQEFDQKIAETFGEEPVKAKVFSCQKDGGTPIIVGENVKCLRQIDDPVLVEKNLGSLTVDDVAGAADKLGQLKTKLDTLSEKMSTAQEKFEQNGKTEQVEVFEFGKEKIALVQDQISQIQEALSDPAELSVSDRQELLMDISTIKKTISEVTVTVASGKIASENELADEMFARLDAYYGTPWKNKAEFQEWRDREKQAFDIIQNCEQYSAASPKTFVPPDPDARVVKIEVMGLVGTKCRFVLHSARGDKAEFLLPGESYLGWNGPEKLLGLTCSGDCEWMTQLLEIVKNGGPSSDPQQVCIQKCVYKNCSEGHFACLEKNRVACEAECGIEKEPLPIGPSGEVDKYPLCVSMCAGGLRCGGDIVNATCSECEEKCMTQYGPGAWYERCLNNEQLQAQKARCGNGEYAEPVEEFIKDKTCITGVVCKQFEPPAGDDPGTGPDVGPTGQVVLPELENDWVSGFLDWLKEWFG